MNRTEKSLEAKFEWIRKERKSIVPGMLGKEDKGCVVCHKTHERDWG